MASLFDLGNQVGKAARAVISHHSGRGGQGSSGDLAPDEDDIDVKGLCNSYMYHAAHHATFMASCNLVHETLMGELLTPDMLVFRADSVNSSMDRLGAVVVLFSKIEASMEFLGEKLSKLSLQVYCYGGFKCNESSSSCFANVSSTKKSLSVFSESLKAISLTMALRFQEPFLLASSTFAVPNSKLCPRDLL